MIPISDETENIDIVKLGKTEFRILKRRTDHKIPMISIGGSEPLGYYVAYKGDVKDCHKIIKDALEAFTKFCNDEKTEN